ncbi:hypothetical protein LTR62_002567 [Meristemomyces frigidus]|uniref:J domain-containing protein n=1 Tax=Meristemomyces frigidus TaxID=1508187 RepID=A0AAN7TFL2_9PEZI|nr:hypothetical protein LTR62_002567 [Meristemomyces frigidus]
MLNKKPRILISAYTYTNLRPLSSLSLPGSSTSSCRARESTRQGTRGVTKDRNSRGYATITGDGSEQHAEPREPEAKAKKEADHHHQWPTPPSGQQHPTPYQILDTTSNTTYTKTRYYRLAKIYHPDLHNPTQTALTPSLKLERYRLIVAAHAILSDPTKRTAYDRFGAGWNGKPETGARRGTYNQPGPFSQSWNSNQDDPIWRNATWEDWEKFYAWRARKESGASTADPQSPLYMRNSYFIVLVAFLAFAGGSANYNRAQDAGTYFVEQRDLVHDRAAKELRKVRQEIGSRGREERIQWFLRQREASMGALAPGEVESMREEKAASVLPEQDICRSGDVGEGGT